MLKFDVHVQEYIWKRDAELLRLSQEIGAGRLQQVKTKGGLIFSELDDACGKCVISHLLKYQSISEDAKRGLFEVSCSGIPKAHIKKEVWEKMAIDPSSPTGKSLLSSRDIVTWAEQNLVTKDGPLALRDYQKEVLRCSAKRLVTRFGRRTGKSMMLMIKALFYCIHRPFKKKNGEKRATSVLIITPRQTQTDNLFDDNFDVFIAENPLLAESIDSYKKNPYVEVKFKNGSSITCLTAGTGTAQAGLAIRSFTADVLILDEANYLGMAEIAAATKILASNADCMFHVSSTPTGIHDFFYEWCFSRSAYKEWYGPTPIVPHWDQIKEDVYQDCFTIDDFYHEYMAEFSAPTSGVFRPDLVQKAVHQIKMSQFKREDDWIYSIGVDWNSNAGTEIVVTGLEPNQKKYFLVESMNVPKSEWTQTVACEAVIDLHLKWNPQFIYVDRGFGEMQIETLKRYSIQEGHKDPRIAKLRDILHPFEFGGTIEIADPKTRKIRKSPAKPFLVKNAVRRIEEESCVIPAEEALLIEQIKAYYVKTVSASGRPVYDSARADLGDHRLDAWMLSLVGYSLILGEISRPAVSPSPTFIIDKPLWASDDVPTFSLHEIKKSENQGNAPSIRSKPDSSGNKHGRQIAVPQSSQQPRPGRKLLLAVNRH